MPITATRKRWRGPGGKILRGPSGKRYLCETCPCGGLDPGVDCPTVCDANTTPQAYDITFAGIADQTCVGNAAYYNATFRFVQHAGSPCLYDNINSLPDVWNGPCTIGPTHVTITSTALVMDITDTGLVNASGTKTGNNCFQTITGGFTSLGAGPPAFARQLNWSAMTFTAVPVNHP